MNVKKAFLWGISTVLLVYFLTLAFQKIFSFWFPLTVKISSGIIYQWLLAVALTIAALVTIGYIVLFIIKYVMKPIHPLRKIFNKIFGTRMGEAKNIVKVKWGGNWFFGWLTGTVIDDEGKKLYRVTVPSAPIPLSAQLMLVPEKRIKFTNMNKTTHFAQLGSLGFDALDDNLEFWPPLLDDE